MKVDAGMLVNETLNSHTLTLKNTGAQKKPPGGFAGGFLGNLVLFSVYGASLPRPAASESKKNKRRKTGMHDS